MIDFVTLIAKAIAKDSTRFRFYYTKADGTTDIYWVRGIVEQDDFIMAEKLDRQGFPMGIRRFNRKGFASQPQPMKQL